MFRRKNARFVALSSGKKKVVAEKTNPFNKVQLDTIKGRVEKSVTNSLITPLLARSLSSLFFTAFRQTQASRQALSTVIHFDICSATLNLLLVRAAIQSNPSKMSLFIREPPSEVSSSFVAR